MKTDNWSQKAIRRRTTGTGRMQHLKKVFARSKVLKRSAALWANKVEHYKRQQLKKIIA